MAFHNVSSRIVQAPEWSASNGWLEGKEEFYANVEDALRWPGLSWRFLRYQIIFCAVNRHPGSPALSKCVLPYLILSHPSLSFVF